MNKKKEISEKSLELNVCMEILQRLRAYPSFRKASWVGLTQREERQQGLDAKIRNTPGVALMLQFKSPWATSKVDKAYTFSINREQHKTLERLGCTDAVHYVLPLYSKWWKLDRDAPDILQDTWLVPVKCIPSSYLVRELTTIQVKKTASAGIKVSGYPRWTPTCDAIRADDYFEAAGLLLDFRSLGIEPSALRSWIDGWEGTTLRFSGLGVFHLPL